MQFVSMGQNQRKQLRDLQLSRAMAHHPRRSQNARHAAVMPESSTCKTKGTAVRKLTESRWAVEKPLARTAEPLGSVFRQASNCCNVVRARTLDKPSLQASGQKLEGYATSSDSARHKDRSSCWIAAIQGCASGPMTPMDTRLPERNNIMLR